MNDRFKFRMWSTHAGRYFDETNDAMLENVFECMKQQICYDCQNPVFRKIYDRIAYNHIADGMVFEQCTGLKDKNGKLIYEGDWLKTKDGYYCYVVWFEGSWWVKSLPSEAMDLEHAEFYKECEVIGNIHENADLLGVVKMTVKSQDELNQPETHSTEVLLEAISKLETTTKEKELLKEILKDEMIKNGERLEEIERLQKQLGIAVKRIEFLKKKTASPYYGNNSYLKTIYQMCDKTLRQIKELEK